MRVIIISAEAVPFCKVGGLADVVGSIFTELLNRKVDAYLLIPYYSRIIREEVDETGHSFGVTMGGRTLTFNILNRDRVFFLASEPLFGRGGIYGEDGRYYEDNHIRFAFFCRASLQFLKTEGLRPDVLHLQDWQTALIPLYLRTLYRTDEFFRDTATVLTIHNAGYQGVFPPSIMDDVEIPREYFHPEGVEFYGKVNFLKAGILFSDIITTVSKRYREEITTPEYGAGLEGVFQKRRDRIYGVLNGIDYSVWSPETDPFIHANYSAEDLRGKALCKRRLLEDLSLSPAGGPLLAFIGRIEPQKGIDLLTEAAERLKGYPVNLIVLGSGERYLEESIERVVEGVPRFSFQRGFDNSLAHRLYAASDMVLIPSRYEPCGLVQLIALRYGTIPIARATGGLADTIVDFDPFKRKGYGILFRDYNPDAFFEAIKRAFTIYVQKRLWKTLVVEAMKQDFSWQQSVSEYLRLYRIAGHEHKG